MTIFDYLNALLFSKNKDCLTSIDQESAFVPYMVSRWASMYSPAVAITVNKLNKYLSVFEDKRSLYILFHSVLPKVKFKKINYIKKNKDNNTASDEKIPLIAKSLEVSQREVNEYIAFLNN